VVCIEEMASRASGADGDQRAIIEVVDKDGNAATAEFIGDAALVDDVVHGHGLCDGAEMSKVASGWGSVRKLHVKSMVLL